MAFKILFLSLFATNCLLALPGYTEPWGKDSNLSMPQEPPLPTLKPLPYQLATALILFHQQVISPADGPRSHFRPTSSSYMLHAIKKYGVLKGFLLGCDRLMRENSEEWVYPTLLIEGKKVKYDPP